MLETTTAHEDLDEEWLRYFEEWCASGAAVRTPTTFIRSPLCPSPVADELERTFAAILRDREFVFVTVHQDLNNLRRRLRNTNLPAPRLGKRLVELLTAGLPIELAYEDILKELFRQVEHELACSVASVRVYENDGKCYQADAPVTHVHMCISLPPGRSYHRFASVLFRLYSRLIYPVPMPIEVAKTRITPFRTLTDLKRERQEISGTGNLNYQLGRLVGERNHPEYSTKQIVDATVFRARLFASKSAKQMKGGTY